MMSHNCPATLYVHYCKLIVGLIHQYYLGFFTNHFDSTVSILLTTTETQPVNYSIEAPGIAYYHNGTISAEDEVILYLPSSVEVSSIYHQDKGIYLTTSSDSVTVIGQNQDSASQSTDSFFALPVMEIGGVYIYYGVSVRRTVVHSRAIESTILIVGTQNNTTLKLTVTQYVNIAMGNTVTNLIPGREYSFVINRLQTVFMESREDLSGTKIVTDKPVSVFSGHQCGNNPWDVGYCSYLTEQIPPAALWGKVYYTAPLLNKRSYTVKILTAYNSTAVNVYCNNTAETYVINEGEFIDRTSQMEYCAIYTNKEVLVVQLSHGGSEDNNYGDPMMTLIPATNRYLNNFDLSTIRNPVGSSYDHYVNIIVKEQYYQPNMIYLIAGGVNRSLVTQQWVPIQVNNTIEAYATQVSIPEGVAQIIHNNPAAQMMTIVYGFANFDGYGHIGGILLSQGCVCNH